MLATGITVLLLMATLKGTEKHTFKPFKIKMVFIWHMVPAVESLKMSISCWVLIFFFALSDFFSYQGDMHFQLHSRGDSFLSEARLLSLVNPHFYEEKKISHHIFQHCTSGVQCTCSQNNGQTLSCIMSLCSYEWAGDFCKICKFPFWWKDKKQETERKSKRDKQTHIHTQIKSICD